jgi:DNA repair exonuclease SbcCD ATPase subunit
MLKYARCSVVFPINGMALSGEITFQPGITAVVGRNGTGKTFKTIELTRYMLFGKKALRGPASDYKKLDGELLVEIKGVDYRVKRNPKGETITIEGESEPLAVGADAVNKKVIELLGFGLEVFDITNASVQKQSNKLTQLTPAKRKELVDEVCGLAQNERAEKDCKEKAKLLKLEADTIRDNLVPLAEPIKPELYEPAAAIKAKLDAARGAEREREQLLRIVNQEFRLPSQPADARKDTAALRQHEDDRARVDLERRQLQLLVDTIPEAMFTEEEIKAAQAWVQYDAELARRGPKPEISSDETADALNIYSRIDILESMNSAVECPECKHLFVPAQELPDTPDHDREYYRKQELANIRWSTPLVEPTGKRIEHSMLQEAHTAIVRQKERQDALNLLHNLTPLPDRSDDLTQAQMIDRAWDQYNAAADAVREALQQQMEAHDQLAKLPPPVDIETLDAAFVAARIYESQLERYETDKIDHLEKIAKIRDLQEESEDFTKGAKRLVEARREVKGYLAPSLSRIASVLITEMTCGKLQQVVVDENMNVSVDGQDVTTLSGAGETAANLALRLALGRTLVGGVFPVFLGDEIDSDADEERSEATFECLRNLKGQFAQVIMITHKPHVVADHIIDMDD